MLEKAINRIVELAKPNIVKHGNDEYSDKKLYRIHNDLLAAPLELSTLSSLIEYIKRSNENQNGNEYIVHVVSPTRVDLISTLNMDRERETLVTVRAEVPRINFDNWMENEKILIAVQSQFVDDPETDRAAVLKFAGTVTSGSIKEYGDDGVTQKATVKHGVTSKVEGIVPSPCRLRPYRTFIEVEQPASEFIFRMREGSSDTVLCALFEADGGMWKNEARRNIREYLEKELEDTAIPVIS